jgi:alanyl-tRNA synthetase
MQSSMEALLNERIGWCCVDRLRRHELSGNKSAVLDSGPMSTHRLYYDDASLQTFSANVLSCEPSSSVLSESGPIAAWQVLLDRTAFYPTSGGQPNDLGTLGQANILDVRDAQENVVHIVDRQIARGHVEGVVDWSRRFDHMQQHTGQHLLSAVFQERFGLPTVSFHLGTEFCTIDLRGPEPSTEILQGAQHAANEVVFQDRPVSVRYGTAEQFAEIGVRKEIERRGLLRAIEIESADLQPCGGTHVRSTGQIGLLVVRRCTRVRQDWRVEFACGARADRVARGDFQLAQSLSKRLSSAPEDLMVAVEGLVSERDAHFRSLREALKELAQARAALLISATPVSEKGLRVIAELLHESHPDLLLPLATELAKRESVVVALFHRESGQFVLAKFPASKADLPGLLKEIFAAHEGKGGGSCDFIRAKLAEARDAAPALALAKRLLLK